MSDYTVLIPEGYAVIRTRVDLPAVGLTLYSVPELPQAQVGYRIDPSGKSLVGPGGWSSNWIVIGHENLCGDPIFLDVGSERLPVYTAAHGQGAWDCVLIAKSPVALFNSLSIVKEVRAGSLDADSAVAKIVQENGGVVIDVEFWSVFMEE